MYSHLFFRMSKRFQRYVQRSGWLVLFLPLLGTFVIGAVFMPMIEKTGTLQSFNNYWWWFWVTILTIGYGDVYPITIPGKLLTIVICTIGLCTAGAIINKLGQAWEYRGRLRFMGLAQLKLKDHIVIYGWREEETQLLVAELLADQKEHEQKEIVLCSASQTTNPMPDLVEFVHGTLASNEVIQKACVADASMVIIHASEDEKSVLATLKVCKVNSTARIIVKLDDPQFQEHLHVVSSRIECSLPLSVALIAQEAKMPGIIKLMRGMVALGEEDELHSVTVPEWVRAFKYKHFRTILMDELEGLALGIGFTENGSLRVVNRPTGNTLVEPGTLIYYQAEKPLTKKQIEDIFARV